MGTNRNRQQFERYRAWQWIKHLALADYIVPWAEKVGSTSKSIYIVDLFAGAATYNDVLTGEKTDGSPVIFARRSLEYGRKYPNRKLGVICTERDGNNFESLSRRLAGFPSCTTLRGGFERHVDTILATMGASPALLLFDPIGLKPIAADTIRPLLARKAKTDVFMVLHFKVVHRTAGMLNKSGYADPTDAGALKAAACIDAVFDSPRWRTIFMNPMLGTVEQRETALLDLYFDEVLGRRFDHLSAYPVRARMGAKVQYWLVHASSHFDAYLLMNDEIVKLEEELLRRTYAGGLEAVIDQQIEMDRAAADAQLRRRIIETLQSAPGATLTFGAVRDGLLDEFFGRVKQGAYSRVLKTLIRDGTVEREQRPAAKFEISERVWLHAPEAVTTAA